MKNAILVAGLTAALASPLALAEVTLYGKAHIAIDYEDKTILEVNEATGLAEEKDDSKTDLVNHDSRLGVKGKTKINDSMAAIFKYELGVDIDGNHDGGSDFISQRNQYVGLQFNGFGKLFGGIHDTPVKQLEGKIDRFGDTNADIGKILGRTVDSQEREKQFLGFHSDSFGGVQFKLATMKGAGTDFGDAISTSIAYGDPKMKKMPFFVGLGYDSAVDDNEDSQLIRLSGGAKMGPVALGAIVEQADTGADGDNADHMRYVLSAAYKIGNGALELQYVGAEELGEEGQTGYVSDANQWSIGWDHKLGGGASMYIMYSKKDLGDNNTDDTDYASIGLVYSF